MSKMVTISVYQRKGGVGKTTLASNLAQILCLIDKRVLLVDNDSQANLSISVGLKPADTNLYDLYKNANKLNDELVGASIISTFLDNLYCITSSLSLDNISPAKDGLQRILSHHIIQENFDYCIIDNCAANDPKTKSAIFASDAILIPVQLEQFGLAGVKQTFDTLRDIYKINEKSIFIIRNFLDRSKLSMACSLAVEQMYPDNVLDTVIPRCSADLQKMIQEEKSLFLSKTTSKLTSIFLDIACQLFGLDFKDVQKIIRKKINKIRAEHLARYKAKKRKALITGEGQQ